MTVNDYDKGKQWCTQRSANADMWSVFWDACAQRLHMPRLVWTKGHATKDDFDKFGLEVKAAIGNYVADVLANAGACLDVVPLGEASAFLSFVDRTLAIQQRAVQALVLHLGAAKGRDEGQRQLCAPRLPRLSLSAAILQSTYVVEADRASRVLSCMSCLQSMRWLPAHRRSQLLSSVCVPTPFACSGGKFP